MKTLISLILIFLLKLAYAGGASYNAKIVTFKETAKDRYTMVFDQYTTMNGRLSSKRYTLRLRHNDYYYSKKSSKTYTLKAYREAIAILKGHAKTEVVFSLGAMGGVWGIPVKSKKDEFWVQTLAIVKGADGAKVVYTMKE